MKNKYAICTGNKVRLFVVSSAIETVNLNMQAGDVAVETSQDGNPSKFMLDEGEIKPLPPQPENTNFFDFENKVWLSTLSLEDFKTAQWAAIKQSRNAAEFGGFDWDGYRFDSDSMSQQRIQGLILIANIDPQRTVDWTLADNTVITLSSAQAIELGVALGAHVNEQHVKARALRVLIDAAQTHEAVQAITWGT